MEEGRRRKPSSGSGRESMSAMSPLSVAVAWVEDSRRIVSRPSRELICSTTPGLHYHSHPMSTPHFRGERGMIQLGC